MVSHDKVTDASVRLVGEDGSVVRTLFPSIRKLILQAEAKARSGGQTVDAIDDLFMAAIEESRLAISTAKVNAAVQSVSQIRDSGRYRDVDIPLTVSKGRSANITDIRPTAIEAPPAALFEPQVEFPDDSGAALAMYHRLAGIDDQKNALIAELSLHIGEKKIADWSKRHYQLASSRLLDAYTSRIPLVVLQGDVGTGKTELAQTLPAALIERGICREARLLKLTTQVRGEGIHGQMSGFLVNAFDFVERYAAALGPDVPLIFMVDEADAIGSSRDGEQMHHEDRVGVNTLLQRLNRLRSLNPRPLVIFITNRLDAVDPAIERRAGLILKFERPGLEARKAILGSLLCDYGFSESDLDQLASGTERNNPSFTASDLVDKVLGTSLQRAIANDEPLSVGLIVDTAETIRPSPRLND